MTNKPEVMNGESLDIAAQRRAELKQLFPGVFTETKDANGKIVSSIDYERLKAELGHLSDIYEGRRERYGIEWPGKRDCMKVIQSPSMASLEPLSDNSVEWDNTENIFIEGDNLEVLKILQKSYYGKVKMIYIDPPYNTGNEFIYPDNYQETLDTYLSYAGLLDDEGRKFTTNTTSEGRFHSKWLNMMYPRIYLARNLLKEDGVLFLSIDDNEVVNARKMCEEIFGEENFVAQMIWEGAFKNDAKQIGVNHEYVLVFTRTKFALENSWAVAKEGVEPVLAEVERLKCLHGDDYDSASKDLAGWFKANKANQSFSHRRFRYIDKIGAYKEDDPTAPGGRKFDLINPNTGGIIPLRKNRGWSFDQQKFNSLVQDGRISFKSDTSIMVRRYLHETDKSTPQSVFYQPARSASERLTKLMGANIFDFPKDEEVIKQFVEMCSSEEDDIIMDFFAGSGTTAHAVMLQNIKDKVNRKYILVQLPERLDEKSIYQAAAFSYCREQGISTNIAALSAQRLKKAGEFLKLNSDNNLLDFGFKYFRLNKSNFKSWNGSRDLSVDVLQSELDFYSDNLLNDIDKESVLFELLLKAGFELTEKIKREIICGKEIYSVAQGALIVCLEEQITEELIESVLGLLPAQFICLDRGFQGNDQLKTNTALAFKLRSQTSDSEMIFKVV